MAEYSTFMQIPYPEENQEPFWDTWESFINTLDEHVYMAKVKTNLMLLGGGTVTFVSATGVLSWTADFAIPYLETGYKILVSYGPDGITRQATIQDGECLYIEVPYAIAADTTVIAQVTNQLTPASSEQWVMGIRYGSSFYMRSKDTF